MGLEINGLNEFEKRLLRLAKQQFPKETKKELRKIARRTLTKARQNTRKLTKKKTGNLLKGWKLGRLYQRGSDYYIIVRNVMPHAHLLEDGHEIKNKKDGPIFGKTTGKHMLGVSLKQIEIEVPAELRGWLTKMIKEAGL